MSSFIYFIFVFSIPLLWNPCYYSKSTSLLSSFRNLWLVWVFKTNINNKNPHDQLWFIHYIYWWRFGCRPSSVPPPPLKSTTSSPGSASLPSHNLPNLSPPALLQTSSLPTTSKPLPPPSSPLPSSPKHPKSPRPSSAGGAAGTSRSPSLKVRAGQERPTSLGQQLKPPGVPDKGKAAPKLSPRLIRKLQIVKSGISFVNNLKIGEQPH